MLAENQNLHLGVDTNVIRAKIVPITTSTYLQQHLRCHYREKSFSCDQCDFICPRKVNLKKHKLTHTSREKLFLVNNVVAVMLANLLSYSTLKQNIQKFNIFIVTGSKIYFKY